MGAIVGGFAASHVLFSSQGVEQQAANVMHGLLEMRRRIQELDPDVLVMAGSDHLNTFSLAMQVTLGVGVADEFTTWGDGVPVTTFAGHRAFAEQFARHAARRGFDLVQIEEVRPDHGMATPKLVADPRNAIPTVPVYLNTLMPIPPSPKRCFSLGQALKEMVETTRPADERVVVMGVGGMSHWICVPEQGTVAEDFDLDFIDKLITGRAEELAAIDVETLERETGNGGLELAAWLFMAGAMPPKARGERLFYEPIRQWDTGLGAVAFAPARRL